MACGRDLSRFHRIYLPVETPLIKLEMILVFIVEDKVHLCRAEMIGLGQDAAAEEVKKAVGVGLYVGLEVTHGMMKPGGAFEGDVGFVAGGEDVRDLLYSGEGVGL